MSVYLIELKTTIANDAKKRMPSLEQMKMLIDDYSSAFKGLVIGHNSFYEYRYDTMISSYPLVDSVGVIGHVTETKIEDDKLFLTVDINEDSSPLEGDYICFYRANFSSSKSKVFDDTHIIAIDLIKIADGEEVLESNLSIIQPINII